MYSISRKPPIPPSSSHINTLAARIYGSLHILLPKRQLSSPIFKIFAGLADFSPSK